MGGAAQLLGPLQTRDAVGLGGREPDSQGLSRGWHPVPPRGALLEQAAGALGAAVRCAGRLFLAWNDPGRRGRSKRIQVGRGTKDGSTCRNLRSSKERGGGWGVEGVPSGARSDPGGEPQCSGMGMGVGGNIPPPPSPRAAVSLEEESEYEGVSALGQCLRLQTF